MSSILVGFEVIIPLIILMGIGYILRITGKIDDKLNSSLNKLVFKLFLPVLIFKNIYNSDLSKDFNLKFLLFAIFGVIISFILTFIIICIIEKDRQKTGVLIQGIFRSNFVIFGIPVITSIFGEEVLGVPSIIIASVVPVYNTLAIIVLEIFKDGKIKASKIIKDIIKNPLIIASFLGLIFLLVRIELPDILFKVVKDVAGIATPLSLIVLGSSFIFTNIKKNFKQIIIGVSGRLIIIPLIFLPIAIYLGFRDVELATLMIMFGAPTAVSSYTMAKEMGGDSDLACSLVVIESILSIITIFIITTVLTTLNYI
jgi:predicted permease